jgi:alpha-tubulin suppressor-like RCC1 family protein
MFRLKLKETTRLDISKYTKEELSLLCKRNYNKTKISASGDHSLVLVGYSTAISPPDPSELNSQGRVFGFGSAKSGQLGTIGKITHETNPILVDTYHIEGTITSVVASWGYSMILNDLGQVFSFGTNDYGQLGSGNYDERKYPSIVSALDDEKIIAVSAGDDHCLLLNDRGQVFVLGSNEFGQLGLKPEEVEREGFEIDENITIPILLDTTGIGEIIAVSAGSSYSMILNSQGQVFSFGTNDVGQLGLGNTHDQITPTMIDHIKIGKVVAISAGDHHSLILNSQGQVFSFGANTYGQLGLGDIKDRTIPTLINTSEMGRIVAVSASNFSLILNSQDQVFGFGDNEYGQLGLDDQIPRMVPTLIDIPEIIAISAGGFHSLFLNSQGQIFSCGNNIHGQLGQGNTNNLLRPTLIRGIIF